MAKTQEIEWAPQYGTAQIYSTGVSLALVNEKGQQIGPRVFCKDFLHDAIRAALHNKPSSIYGYKTNAPEIEKIDLDRPRVLLFNTASDAASHLEAAQEFMNKVDEAVGAKKPTFYRTASNPEAQFKGGVSMWIGDPIWMISPPAFSLWTLLLRNAHSHQPGDSWETTINNIITKKVKPGVANDGLYLEFALVGLKLMAEKGMANVFNSDIKANYPENMSTGILHHYGGCVSFGDASNKQYFKECGWEWPTVTKTAPSICHA